MFLFPSSSSALLLFSPPEYLPGDGLAAVVLAGQGPHKVEFALGGDGQPVFMKQKISNIKTGQESCSFPCDFYFIF